MNKQYSDMYSSVLCYTCKFPRTKILLAIMYVTCLKDTGFINIFTSIIHSENDYQIQSVIYQIDNKDLLDYSVQTN